MTKHKRGFTSHRHPELDSGSCCISNQGFTLLEVLVVVIIIAVLAAIAVPQYKHAVLKSRFSAVMPMAKSVADAQEVYYLGNGQYALNQAELDVTPAIEGTNIALAPETQEEQYAYVAASRTDYPSARYIVYQKHSPKFAGTIHCEADTSDENALWLCEQGLGGTEIPGGGVNTTQGKTYRTFLLEGNIGDDDTFDGGTGEEDDNGELGGTTVDAETQAKVNAFMTTSPLCTNIEGICHDNGDGTISRCLNYDVQIHKCVVNFLPDANYMYSRVYNADGILIEEKVCSTTSTSGSECYGREVYNYDSVTGKVTSSKRRRCQKDVVMIDEFTCPDGKYDTSSVDYNFDQDFTTQDRSNCSTFGPHGECNPN